MLGKAEGRRRRGRQRMRWLDGITDSTDEFEQTPGNRGQGSLMCCSPWGRKELDKILRRYNNNKINTAPSTYELPSYVWLCKAMLLNL